MGVAVVASGGDQTVDLSVGEILARPNLGVVPATRGFGYCPVYDRWRQQRQVWFCRHFPGLFPCYCPAKLFCGKMQGRMCSAAAERTIGSAEGLLRKR